MAAALLVLTGAAVGGLAVWLLWRRDVATRVADHERERLRGDQVTAEVQSERTRAEQMRADLEAERISRAKLEGETGRLRQLEEEFSRAQAMVRELTGERSQLSGQAGRVPLLETEIERLTGVVLRLTADNNALEARQTEQIKAHADQIAALTRVRGEIGSELKVLAGEALKANQTSFLELAMQVFQGHREAAVGDLQSRQEAIANLLSPVATTLNEYRQGLTELEKTRLEAYAGLATELRNVVRIQGDVRAETAKLVNALRAAPKTRGRWGEQQLHNVLELAGMTPYVDFVAEENFTREDARLRPDAIIRLPGARYVVVDAKTSMTSYLDAVETVDDVERETHLVRHAQQLRQQMTLLSGKAYWDGLTVTPDFVAMFVPGDNFFAAAMEHDRHLFEDAVAARVLIVTPTTLIALAKAIAFGWRQEKITQNAQQIADLGRDLYKRLQVMGAHLVQVGSGLDRTVRRYNAFLGSLEGSVMPQARKFTELDLEGAQDSIPPIAPIERDVRLLRTDRDLIIPEGMTPEGEMSAEVKTA